MYVSRELLSQASLHNGEGGVVGANPYKLAKIM